MREAQIGRLWLLTMIGCMALLCGSKGCGARLRGNCMFIMAWGLVVDRNKAF